MSVATAPQLTGRSLLGKVALALQARARRRAGQPSKLALAIQDHSGTITALGLIDTGLWHTGSVAGWIGLGVSVLVAELKIRG